MYQYRRSTYRSRPLYFASEKYKQAQMFVHVRVTSMSYSTIYLVATIMYY